MRTVSRTRLKKQSLTVTGLTSKRDLLTNQSLGYLLHRKIHHRMSLLPECLPTALQESALSRILLRVAEQHTARRQCIGCRLPESLHSQHTGRNDGDIIQPGIEDRLRRIRDSISVSPVVSVSHILVSCITFLAFCFPRWIYICVVFKFA